jgi:hypothetical protein
MNYRVLNSIYNYNNFHFFFLFNNEIRNGLPQIVAWQMQEWALDCIHGLHFLETLGRVWGTRFYVWLFTFAGAACLFACNAPALDVFDGGTQMQIVKIYDYKTSLDCEV